MNRKRVAKTSVAVVGVLGAAYLASAAMAQDEKPPVEAPPMLSAEQVKTIWPAGLQKLTGRYVYAQVASPGGLWERLEPSKGRPQVRQVSLNEVPAALRQRLTTAEIVISDLELPTMIEAAQRESPSKRGMLRFYTEAAIGKVVVKNLPGMSGHDQDTGNFSGRVLLQLNHQSHSNPSVLGVLQARQQGEATWGAATLDYADLTASSLPADLKEGTEPASAPKKETAPEKKVPATGKPAAKATDKPKAGNGKAPAKDHPDHEEDLEGHSIIGNARVLRAGVEIFAFVEWENKTPKGVQRIHGSVRLVKAEAPAPPANPQSPMPMPLDTE